MSTTTRPRALRSRSVHGCRDGVCNCPRAYQRCVRFTDYPDRGRDPYPTEREIHWYRHAGTVREIPNIPLGHKIVARSHPGRFIVSLVRLGQGSHMVTIQRDGYRGIQTVSARGITDARTTANQIHNDLRHDNWRFPL